MTEQSEFMNNVLEILSPLGDVTTKRMFGGYGIFLDAKMFALVNKAEELFLKADDQNKQAFILSGLHKIPSPAGPWLSEHTAYQ